MPRRREITADGKAWCSYHAQWEPVEDFYPRNGSVSPTNTPRPNCRLAEQTIRDHDKDADPARSAIEGRAKEHAGHLSKAVRSTIGYKWVLIELNWRGLIPIMRAMLSPDGRCLNCAKHWSDPKKLHIEHRVPALGITDYAGHHARNLWIACEGCNWDKGRHDNDREWIEREQREWVIARHWASKAGREKGWPPFDPDFGGVQQESYPGAQLALC